MSVNYWIYQPVKYWIYQPDNEYTEPPASILGRYAFIWLINPNIDPIKRHLYIMILPIWKYTQVLYKVSKQMTFWKPVPIIRKCTSCPNLIFSVMASLHSPCLVIERLSVYTLTYLLKIHYSIKDIRLSNKKCKNSLNIPNGLLEAVNMRTIH